MDTIMSYTMLPLLCVKYHINLMLQYKIQKNYPVITKGAGLFQEKSRSIAFSVLQCLNSQTHLGHESKQ
jgi:hypothetical protein